MSLVKFERIDRESWSCCTVNTQLLIANIHRRQKPKPHCVLRTFVAPTTAQVGEIWIAMKKLEAGEEL
jgi:hypothetical protein